MPEIFAPYDEDIPDDEYDDYSDFTEEEAPDQELYDLEAYTKSMEERPMPTGKPKRVFLVCHSKNCKEAKRAHTRCTISMMELAVGSPSYMLNRRKFCVLYSSPEILNSANTPQWKISPDKPGERTLKEREQKAEQEFIQNNPEFLEIS